MNAVATTEPKTSYASVPMDQTGAGGMLAPKSLGEVVAFAAVMARADLALPKHLRGNDGACMAVAMQAMRWEMDPFAVANKSYSVNDRLAFEAQLVAAVVHTRAPIKGRPDYTYSGQGPTRRCKVTCTMRDGETREYESPEFGQITTKNSPLWKSDPDQQLGYFSIRSWARRHAPEVILGVYTPDEVAEFRDVTPRSSGLAARLNAPREPATEGFRSHTVELTGDRLTTLDEVLDGDQLPDHDPLTGEVSDELPADRQGSATAEGEGQHPPGPPQSADDADRFPGDLPPNGGQATGTAPHAATAALTLAQRITAYRKRAREATTVAKLRAVRSNAADLRRDIDRADPDEVGTSAELERWTDDLMAELERAEQEGAR